MSSTIIITLLLWSVTSCQGEYETRGRVRINTVHQSLEETIHYDPNNPLGLDIARINSIQADRLERCDLLISIGSHITCSYTYSSHVLTGDKNKSGYVDGPALDARFRGIAGFVQLPNGEVLISDQGNKCIRKLNRYTHSVSTFRCNNEKLTDYVPWETFNQPSTMQYDDVTNTVYLLDTKDGHSIVVGLELDSQNAFIAPPKPIENGVIHDFTYDKETHSFAVVEDSLLVNFTSLGAISKQRFDQTFLAISSDDDIYALTTANGHVFIYDIRENCMLFNLCVNFHSASCELSNPTAVSILDGQLAVGSTSKAANEDGLLSTHIAWKSFTIISDNVTYTPEFCRNNATTKVDDEAGLSLSTTLQIVGAVCGLVATIWTIMELPCTKKRLKKCKNPPSELIPGEYLMAITMTGISVGFPVAGFEDDNNYQVPSLPLQSYTGEPQEFNNPSDVV